MNKHLAPVAGMLLPLVILCAGLITLAAYPLAGCVLIAVAIFSQLGANQIGVGRWLVLFLMLSIPASAQETPIRDSSLHIAPYAFLAAGQASDVIITNRNFNRGCTEMNAGVFGAARPSIGRLVTVKALGVLPAVIVTALLQKSGHQKAANVVGLIGGSIGFGAAGYNLTVHCGGAR